jgi:hypothetical protein
MESILLRRCLTTGTPPTADELPSFIDSSLAKPGLLPLMLVHDTFRRGDRNVKAVHFLMWGSLAIVISAAAVANAQVEDRAGLRQASYSPASAPSNPVDDASALAPVPDDVGCDLGQCDPCCAPRWTFSADGMIMQRSSPDSLPLFRTDWGRDGDVVYDASELDFDVAGGWRLGAIRHGQDWDLELNYFQLDGFEARAEVDGDVVAVTDRYGANLAVDDPAITYRSEFYSTEFSLRRACNPCLSWLIGFRYVELDERYTVDGIGGIVPVPVHFYQYSFNHLYGLQIGADGILLCRGRLMIEGLLKAGIYGNHARQNGVQIDTAPIYGETYRASGEMNHAAFLGELGLVGKYQFSDHLALRAGYQLMWMDGVATATDQITVNELELVDTGANGAEIHNTVFYHGAIVGAELTW